MCIFADASSVIMQTLPLKQQLMSACRLKGGRGTMAAIATVTTLEMLTLQNSVIDEGTASQVSSLPTLCPLPLTLPSHCSRHRSVYSVPRTPSLTTSSLSPECPQAQLAALPRLSSSFSLPSFYFSNQVPSAENLQVVTCCNLVRLLQRSGGGLQKQRAIHVPLQAKRVYYVQDDMRFLAVSCAEAGYSCTARLRCLIAGDGSDVAERP